MGTFLWQGGCSTFSDPKFQIIWRLFYRLKFSRIRFQPTYFRCEDERGVCIVPLAVSRSRKRIIDLSQRGPIDYYDVITSNRDGAFISDCLKTILSQYPGYTVSVDNINESSALYGAVEHCLHRSEEVCVKIAFGSDKYEDYFGSLSKHQRQNIRTAYNKLQREGMELSLKKYDKDNKVPFAIWNECMKFYELRCDGKNNTQPKKNVLSSINKIWNRFINPINHVLRTGDGTMFVVYINGTPSAYMGGFFDKDRTTFYVPRLSINNDFYRYDAGILLLVESIKLLLKDGIKCLDLTRGNEPYKYAMGGVEHYNYCATYSTLELENNL